MNKTAIKNFAVWARRKLIADITIKAGRLGITENGIAEALPQSTADLKFFDIGTKDYAEVSGVQVKQREALVRVIKEKERDSKSFKDAFEYVVEEVAYTWFNRLIAIRFMEINDYLPSGIRVLSSENPSKNEPDFVTTPFETDLSFTPYEQDRVYQLKDENKWDELFRMLFIKQCNKLNEILPELFQKTEDYTELLLTISYSDTDGIVHHLVHDIDEKDFDIETIDEGTNKPIGQVEIIGWMYQYYNIEPKDKVFADLKKNIKIAKEHIPAATQVFTPDWIVRYMVENSLGRLWLEGHPNDALKDEWRYYLDEAEQKDSVVVELNKIHKQYQKISPEEIKVIDPCMGSGHILVYAFDVLIQIYESCGYAQRDAARSILENNIFGLDIDKRAYQLSYFALMMKARQYSRRILNEGIKPNVFVIEDNLLLTADVIDYIANGNQKIKSDLKTISNDLINAKEYGSIIDVTPVDFSAIYHRIEEMKNGDLDIFSAYIPEQVTPIIRQAEVLAQKYDIVITNPPYAGRRNLNGKICDYLDSMYPNSKMDLFSAFIERNLNFCSNRGFSAYMTPFVWLFLSSYAGLREKLISQCSIDSFVQPEENSFQEAAVSICAFVLRKNIRNYCGTYVRQSQFHNPKEQEERFLAAASGDVDYKYSSCMHNYLDYPDNRYIYWAGNSLRKIFSQSKELGSVCQPRQGMATTNNDLFLRLWHEVLLNKIGFGRIDEEDAYKSQFKWFPYNKGGGFRKWYGNFEYCVNYENKGKTICDYIDNTPGARVGSNGRVINRQFFFKKSITWSDICGSSFAARACPNGFIFDVKGSSAFVEERLYPYILAFLNSSVSIALLNTLNPTITTQVGDLKQLPFVYDVNRADKIADLVEKSVKISQADWDSFETSWDFTTHPLIRCASFSRAEMIEDAKHHIQDMNFIEEAFTNWSNECYLRFTTLKANEEELNRIFIEIYGLQDELSPEVAENDVTVRKADLSRDVRSLISYAVGCMFGRYSLDADGIAYAGGTWDNSKHSTFIPDADNCLPITDEEYFRDDIVGRFVEFVKVVFGEHTLEENLSFIANALGNKGKTSREIIRNYFLNDFINDHNKTYQKRPIYWLFDSGKQNGFKALVYMHRWNADTIGNMRVEYLHKMQRVYENEIDRMQEVIDNSHDNKEISTATKRKEKLQKQLKETKDYDAKVAHLALSRIDIDLDDGVKVNYEKVQTAPDGSKVEILAKIK